MKKMPFQANAKLKVQLKWSQNCSLYKLKYRLFSNCLVKRMLGHIIWRGRGSLICLVTFAIRSPARLESPPLIHRSLFLQRVTQGTKVNEFNGRRRPIRRLPPPARIAVRRGFASPLANKIRSICHNTPSLNEDPDSPRDEHLYSSIFCTFSSTIRWYRVSPIFNSKKRAGE